MPKYKSNLETSTGRAKVFGDEQELHRRKYLLLLLLMLLLMLCVTLGFFFRYLMKPEPIPDMLPKQIKVNYPPHYLYSIYGMDKPVGVALSPNEKRIYVTESDGERMVKIFDRDGKLLGKFTAPETTVGERAPVYIATDKSGRVFVSDRTQGVIYIYTEEGRLVDVIISPTLTLSEYVAKHIGSNLPAGTTFSYNWFSSFVHYQLPGQGDQTLPVPTTQLAWGPMGIRFDKDGNMWVTNLLADRHNVLKFPANVMKAKSWEDFNPPDISFGQLGKEAEQFEFPNIAVSGSDGRIYISDGNNARVSAWNAKFKHLLNFGRGTGDQALNLPRGAWINKKDIMFVADAVGQTVRVYDVSGDEPVFLYIFGDFGTGDGLFNYPNDIVTDQTGRLYIADRENNRIQVWSH